MARGRRPGEQAVLPANVPEQGRRGTEDRDNQQPDGPRCEKHELALMKQTGRILEQKFEHEGAFTK